MSEIYFFPAQHGDAFLIHCEKGGEEGWVVVDGGPSRKKGQSVFLQEVENLPQIDLMVLTHHDDDHIEGIRAYVNMHKGDHPFPVKRLWVNCARHTDFQFGGDMSAVHARDLTEALSRIQKDNEIKWCDYITDDTDTGDINFADIEILSPSVDILKKYIIEYEKRIGMEVTPEEIPLTAEQEANDLNVSLEELAKRPKTVPSEANYSHLVNMASITLILRSDDLSVLMLGDSFPKQIEDALTAKGYSKDNKLYVDFVKVAHHGSRSNISNELLDMIDCRNFLISTNGGQGRSYHPTREALANIICHPGRNRDEKVHLHFNYTLRSIADKNGFKLFNEGEKCNYNFEIHEPDENIEGSHYRATRY